MTNNSNFSFSFQFANREEYLKQRKTWKEVYAQFSIVQRRAKVDVREKMRRYSYADDAMTFMDASKAMRDLARNKKAARALLDSLQEAEKRAQLQYLQERERANNQTHS